MKTTITYILLFFILNSMQGFGQKSYNKGTDLIKAIHTKYYKGPCKAYTFSQKNTHYNNDTVIGNSEWHEAVEFPDKFRIQYGKKENGRYIVFKNDSVFNFKNHELHRSGRDTNTLLLLLGGMFYRELNDVFHRLEKADYNMDKISTQKWNEQDVYVIGTDKADFNSNQIWVDKTSLRILRIIEKMHSGDMMDMRFEAHQKMCNGYIETKVSFRKNGALQQEEAYYDIKETATFIEK
jgi:hypothetical protein